MQMLHIGGQIDIMNKQLDEIYLKDNKCDLSAAIARSLINKHHKIISFADSIENVFSNIALMQFFSNTLIICCIGFLIVTVSIHFANVYQKFHLTRARKFYTAHTDHNVLKKSQCAF